MIFIPLELMINVYRISRITNWNIGTVNMLTGITIIVEFIVGTILLFFLTKKVDERSKIEFWDGYSLDSIFCAICLHPRLSISSNI